MDATVGTILFVFGLIGIGWLAQRTGLLKAGTGQGLADFAISVAVPVLLFKTMAKADFTGAAPFRLWAAYFSAVIVAWTAGHLLIRLLFGRDRRAGVVAGVSSAFSNLVLLGVPLVLSLEGQAGFEILSLIVAVHLPLMMTASIVLFEWADRGGERRNILGILGDVARKLAVNPLIIGILAGLAWRITGLPLAGPFGRIIDSLAGIAGPLALFAMGMSLNDYGLKGNIGPALVLAAVKLAVMPAAALGFALLFGLPQHVATVAVLAASLPAGVNSYLIAMRFGTGQGLAANTMTLATLLAALTTGFWYAVAQAVFG